MKHRSCLLLVFAMCFGCHDNTQNSQPKAAQAKLDKKLQPSPQVQRQKPALNPPKKQPPKPRPRKKLKQRSTLTMMAVGDIMVHGSQLRAAYQRSCRCYRFDDVFAQVAPLLKRADLAIGNLETTLPGKSGGYSGFPNFGVPDSFAQALKRAGFDVLVNANNHILDKGKKGLARTLDALKEIGIHRTGAYRSLDEYQAPENRFVWVEKKGFKIAVASYTSHVNHPRNAYRRLRFGKKSGYPSYLVNLDSQKNMARDLALARRKGVDLIIVYHHFGKEYSTRSSQRQRKVVRQTFYEGADIVIGAHPHVVQPFAMKKVRDRYGVTKDRLVAYSLGNFVSNMRRLRTSGGLMLKISLAKQWTTKATTVSITKVKAIPLWVYVSRRNKKRRFLVLPLQGSMQKVRMSKGSRKKMKRFYRDIRQRLRLGSTQE